MSSGEALITADPSKKPSRVRKVAPFLYLVAGIIAIILYAVLSLPPRYYSEDAPAYNSAACNACRVAPRAKSSPMSCPTALFPQLKNTMQFCITAASTSCCCPTNARRYGFEYDGSCPPPASPTCTCKFVDARGEGASMSDGLVMLVCISSAIFLLLSFTVWMICVY
ncbi:hypothetical protein SDRG_03424 [Saprolegnia diclina VS20]|uniref:Uncharacterized protein n=1 Tax=Saprolegnia diclina (strain VS20) TaxID=1156394 RepID=T0QMA2_SAPDV|nr:hypothetical protein SDRG_03424 [Saprolegnia diclina VS20]EQC39219.1 hypothetical protein SDRG_03424 [Saprolegnia diclina VS20]|eukprot:XP_008607280.1 hypothetical protein SDRG_03424 [Saprolegnia diclina VS20]